MNVLGTFPSNLSQTCGLSDNYKVFKNNQTPIDSVSVILFSLQANTNEVHALFLHSVHHNTSAGHGGRTHFGALRRSVRLHSVFLKAATRPTPGNICRHMPCKLPLFTVQSRATSAWHPTFFSRARVQNARNLSPSHPRDVEPTSESAPTIDTSIDRKRYKACWGLGSLYRQCCVGEWASQTMHFKNVHDHG